MKLRTALILSALGCTSALAATPSAAPAAPQPNVTAETAQAIAPVSKRLSGSLTVGYSSNYVGRGYVPTNTIVEGEGCINSVLQTKYNLDEEGTWSWNAAVVYNVIPSGHTLYGNPCYDPRVSYVTGKTGHIKQMNVENEFVVSTSVTYKKELWNVTLGYDMVHGGMLGVMAKHYHKQGASNVNEVFIRPEWTPAPWVSVNCTTRYSIQGIYGWWFEPQVTFKAPLIGTPENVKLAAKLDLGASFTADYFSAEDKACSNGGQTWWFRFSTPWFIQDNLILTPSISCHWAGKGAMKSNNRSEIRAATLNELNVPFKNFAVVAGVHLTYTF